MTRLVVFSSSSA